MSPILAMVAFGMTVARYAPVTQNPRDRVHSDAVWQTTVFVTNVIAPLLMGLHARAILLRLRGQDLGHALFLAGAVLLVAIAVRLIWLMMHWTAIQWTKPPGPGRPSAAGALFLAWCGMRGLVTLATAFALPGDFPGRDQIVLSAFQPVIRRDLKLRGRTAILDSALATLEQTHSERADAVRAQYETAKEVARNPDDPQGSTEYDACG